MLLDAPAGDSCPSPFLWTHVSTKQLFRLRAVTALSMGSLTLKREARGVRSTGRWKGLCPGDLWGDSCCVCTRCLPPWCEGASGQREAGTLAVGSLRRAGPLSSSPRKGEGCPWPLRTWHRSPPRGMESQR
ncbi:hypothetical protein mRhiFer1_009265 [Rhinolophus ferrumequinum]|uniref:Uncharacterized protein n=1 Tax=Rhinolophus ferrumequinum TaxID=59479 RepID=A0A7J7S7Y3_RHIFE|nr:hypothetical protein mRhiFer1_009265 [Rhinolophus ferrumequinum]